MHSNKNNHILRFFIAIIAIVLIGSIILTLRTCGRRTKPTATFVGKNEPTPADIILKQTDLYLFGKKNLKDCQIQAEESKLFPAHNEIECTNVVCKLTTIKNSIATLQAPKAYINQQTKSMFLPGTVRGSFKDWLLSKQDVFYDADKRVISAGATKLSSQSGVVVQAPRSKIDLDNEVIRLENGVSSSFER